MFDAQGRLRYVHFGEGNYDETEKNIQLLLAEAGMDAEGPMTEAESDVDFSKIRTPETYIGYERQESLGSSEPVLRDSSQTYSVAAEPAFNRFYLGGAWTVRAEHADLDKAPGEVVFLYEAGSANLVMGGQAKAEVTLGGLPVPEDMRGADVFVDAGKTYVNVNDERLYEIVDAKGAYGRHLLRIRFLDPGVRLYAFTFG